jgi:hypothetical protein
MKPLAFSVYCPNDCDRRVQGYIDPEKTEPLWINKRPDPDAERPIQTMAQPTSVSSDVTDMDWDWIDKLDWDCGTD